MTTFRLPKIDVTQWLDRSRWLDGGVLLAVLLACGTALSLNVADPDLWGHVQYGRDAWQHGLPLTTTYSYIAQGYPWVNHEILAELALAAVNDTLGGIGLMAMKCLLGLVVIGLVMRGATRKGIGLIATCTIALLVAVSLGNHWSLRPQLVSYVSFTLLLALLAWCFDGWEGGWRLPQFTRPQSGTTEPLAYNLDRLKFLWLVPVLMMIWTNSHGGFLAGYCVFVAYLGLRSVEAIANLGRKADGLVLRFVLMAAAGGAATFINPYAHHFHLWLWDDLKVPRPEIVEWRSPDFGDPSTIPFILLCACFVACIALSKRSRDLTHCVILVLILWQALTHHRHIAFFAIACGFWLPAHLESVLKRFRLVSDDADFSGALSPKLRLAFAGGLIVALVVCSVQLVGRLGQLKVERDMYPVAALDYVAQRNLTGKMVVTFNWAQYALAAVGPREGSEGILVHIDGRCRTGYSQRMLDEHFDFILGDLPASERYRDPASGPFDPARVLQSGDPDLVLISREQQPSVNVMNRQRDRWVVLYQDELAQLWGRTAKYGDPRSPHYIPLQHRSIGNEPQNGFTPWPALPTTQL